MRKRIFVSMLSALCVIAILQAIIWISTSNVSHVTASSPAGVLTGETVVPAQNRAPDPPGLGQPMTAPTGRLAITPPVTESSIRDYIAANPIAGGITGTNVQVTSIQFTTMGQLRTLLGTPDLDSYPPGEQVAYVIVVGDFGFSDADGNQHSYQSGYRVFSIETGNELFGGATP